MWRRKRAERQLHMIRASDLAGPLGIGLVRQGLSQRRWAASGHSWSARFEGPNGLPVDNIFLMSVIRSVAPPLPCGRGSESDVCGKAPGRNCEGAVHWRFTNG
jgi:hypothetical protein